VNSCPKCQIYERSTVKYGTLRGYIQSKQPLQNISTDVFGPFSLDNYTDFGKGYFLAVSDTISRYTKIFLIKDLRSKTITKKIKQGWIDRIGRPKTILSDNGTCYVGKEFKDMCRRLQI